jgi:hypothetical protein
MSTTPSKPDEAASTSAKPPAGEAAAADSVSSPGPRGEANPDPRGQASAEAKAEPSDDPAEIKRDIDRTRDELGETAEALAQKVDVPARFKEKVHETTDTVQAKAEQVKHEAQAKAQQALNKLPPPARERVEQLSTTARQRPLPTAVLATAVLALVVGVALGRLWHRSRGAKRAS